MHEQHGRSQPCTSLAHLWLGQTGISGRDSGEPGRAILQRRCRRIPAPRNGNYDNSRHRCGEGASSPSQKRSALFAEAHRVSRSDGRVQALPDRQDRQDRCGPRSTSVSGRTGLAVQDSGNRKRPRRSKGDRTTTSYDGTALATRSSASCAGHWMKEQSRTPKPVCVLGVKPRNVEPLLSMRGAR